ncbi:MAG TPA: MmcQ/YjbR family DNA-binding protein [Ferruginibacter sp.]|nr:MmcQ/YjbR family DNA-binding protein [Ferruginibacter sp.]
MHNIEQIREFALALPGVEEGFPFGEDTLVFKVGGKMFLLLPLDEADCRFNAKCNPDRAVELREEYPENILPGFHMNKSHWNTVVANNRISSTLIRELIQDSYHLVKPRPPRSKK